MSLTRNESRKKAMTVLYQESLYKKNKIDYKINDLIEENIDNEDKFSLELINGVIDNIENIDTLANKYLGSWPINRLGLTDAAILRIAIYELLYTKTDGKIIIDEAIEISKKYSDEKVAKIINGVLDKIYKLER